MKRRSFLFLIPVAPLVGLPPRSSNAQEFVDRLAEVDAATTKLLEQAQAAAAVQTNAALAQIRIALDRAHQRTPDAGCPPLPNTHRR